jgi:hypothetical protein
MIRVLGLDLVIFLVYSKNSTNITVYRIEKYAGSWVAKTHVTGLFSGTRKWRNVEVSKEFFLFHQDISLEHEEEKRNVDFRYAPP